MELQTTSQTPITPTPPNRASRDSGNRRESWGLGIVLTNSDNDLDFEHAAATMGLMTTNYYPQDASGDNSTVALPSASRSQQSLHKQPGNDDQQNNSAFSFFGRLANSISALVSSNNNDADEDLYLPLDSKSQIEDMLESYYLSQGRPVPEWVNKPPPDPPMSIEVQKTSSTTIDRSSQIPVSSDRSSSKSNSQGVISRSFARLNFAKITRPQISFGIRGSSASASENSNAENTRRSAHDSGFNSPLGPDPQGLNQTPSISVQMVDELSEPRFNTPTDSEQLMTNTSASRSTETFQLDSDQLAASVSASDRESSPGYFSPRWFHKSPKTAPHRNRTVVDRWLRSEDKQNGSKKQATVILSRHKPNACYSNYR
ncbi:hypothetical protein GGF39_003038 [Coemansia sp. RSA 1721]|nr:hypothetical protein GGF39_003038 [Coemansia sp. RSA 1721]